MTGAKSTPVIAELGSANLEMVLDSCDTWCGPGSGFGILALVPRGNLTGQRHGVVADTHLDPVSIQVGVALEALMDLALDVTYMSVRFECDAMLSSDVECRCCDDFERNILYRGSAVQLGSEVPRSA
jgi:hypothetical protein